MFCIQAAIVLSSVLSPPTPTRSPTPPPAHIILIRHAERLANPFNPHLSSAGVRRSERLVSFMATDPAMIKLGTPIAVYAAYSTVSGSGQRTLETIAPLAKALKLTVETPERGNHYVALAKLILANPALSGKTVLICWNHEWIPQFAVALGITPEPEKWGGTVYDEIYIVSYHDGKATLAISRYP